jgi:murein tripeptide amidase MpaA
MPYLNIAEVESALSIAASAPYTRFTELIALPNPTWEGRICHAIKIANGDGSNRPGIYFLGGVHAREWGSADILINFVAQLEQAYQTVSSLSFGTRTFLASEIQTLVNTFDIFVFPQANPDGRNYSMSTEALWRKNRRTAPPSSAACTGVDLNRNYDFLWNFPAYFNVSASGIVDSTDPCNYQLYNGPGPFSEPESRNAKSIFDSFPNVSYFVDLHCYGEDVLYSWGDDEDQTFDPNMNFHNPAFDGARGVAGDAYKEYIPGDDLSTALDLANTFRDGIQAVRGKTYTVKPAFNLYPTAGTSDDYAYSRHFLDPAKQRVISYTLEWGTEFQPPYSEMQNIIQEITCGLLAFCLRVRERLKQCVFVVNRDPIGQNEIDARRLRPRNSPGGLPVPDAFRVVVDGFAAADLGVTGPGSTLPMVPTMSPGTGMTTVPAGNTSDNGDYGTEIQRFTFFYGIDFPDDTAFGFAGPTETVTLNVTAGTVPASGQFDLIKQPDPFMLHGDPSWLSVDLRVFVVRAGETKFGVTMGADASAAPGFIQQLLGTISPAQFDSLPTVEDDETAKLFVQPTDSSGQRVFNFAMAKVHYIGLIGAANVRVFFRLFNAQSTSTAFDPSTTYRRVSSNPRGQPIPLAGIQGGDYVTIPCFADARIDTTAQGMDQQTDDFNRKDLTPSTGVPEVDQFYGCWLDINQPFKPDGTANNVLPIGVPATNVDGPFTSAVPIQRAILRNLHQCLVAEIAFDATPIPPGKDTSNWDKLAQRNLAWSDVGSAQALSTFEIRPTPAGLPARQTPDELVIDWGNTPNHSSAQIYLPAVSAAEVLAMAARMYTSHRLTRLDDHTLQCLTGGITYIPIPPGADVNYAGLLSVNLPATVRPGETFGVVVRQVTNAFGKPAPPPPEIRAEAAVAAEIEWRRVLGAFQLTIPVKTKEILLVPEQRDLAVLRWIGEAIPNHSRWYPVFHRYLHQIAGRVRTFGGDPAQILPSPTGEVRRPPEPEEAQRTFTGKIAGLIFDHFGDFEGFLLETDERQHRLHSRERDLAELAGRAWRERLRITVCVEQDDPHRPLTIILHEPPTPFDT